MTGSQSVLDDNARFEVDIINMTQHCTEIKQSKALGAVYWISTGPLALLLRALTIPRMRLWVCCFWCCRSTHCVAHTLPTTLSSQRLWPTRTCSTVSLFNTVFGRCTEKKKDAKKSNSLHGLLQCDVVGLSLTSGMVLICLAERENTSLPKCSTSPMCQFDGSLKETYHRTCAPNVGIFHATETVVVTKNRLCRFTLAGLSVSAGN